MKKKKYFIIAGIIVLLVIVAVILIFAIPPNAKKVPQALSEGFAENGRFEFSCMVETGGEGREYFWLIGESSGESRHIEGRVLGSQVDLYYVDGQIYRYDMIAEEWYCYSAENLAEAAELYAELEPAAAFTYESLIEIEYLGRGSAAGRTCYNFSVIPVATGWVAEFFTDIEYIVSLSRGGELLTAELIATLKDDPQTTMRAFVILEEDNNIQIEAPPCNDANNNNPAS